MIAKATTPRYVLLDANIVIEAYRLGTWDLLLEKMEICVPSVVTNEEALFYSRQQGAVPKPIQLRELIRLGRIKEVAATADQMMELLCLFDRVFIEGIHPGEQEALALLHAGQLADTLFCTSDQVGIQALAMIGQAESGISMEKLLRRAGLERRLDKQFGESFFRHHLDLGKEYRITGRGMRR